MLNANRQAYDDAATAPIYSRNTFALSKYLDTEVGGYQQIDQDTKLEGKEVRCDGDYYNPRAPAKAPAGRKRSADAATD